MKKMLTISATLAIIVGVISVAGGVWGILFTYKNVVRENITTPNDASLPSVLVRGPFTIKSQADVIRKHALKTTEGKTYAEMPRQIEQLDASGNPVIDAEGKAVMKPNIARDLWITATTLTTALNLAIVTYALSGLVLLLGLISIWTGITFYVLRQGMFLTPTQES